MRVNERITRNLTCLTEESMLDDIDSKLGISTLELSNNARIFEQMEYLKVNIPRYYETWESNRVAMIRLISIKNTKYELAIILKDILNVLRLISCDIA